MTARLEPTVGDQVRTMRAFIAELNLDIADNIGGGERIREYVAALQERRQASVDQLAAIGRLSGDERTAHVVKLRASVAAELAVCERALRQAGAPLEAADG